MFFPRCQSLRTGLATGSPDMLPGLNQRLMVKAPLRAYCTGSRPTCRQAQQNRAGALCMEQRFLGEGQAELVPMQQTVPLTMSLSSAVHSRVAPNSGSCTTPAPLAVPA